MGIALRRTCAAAIAAALMAVAGCGGDDEKKASSAPADTATTEQATAEATDTATAPDAVERTDATTAPGTETGGGTGGTSPPEDQEGGAGDEVPNSTPAQITGRGGKVSPGRVSVPPFIAITVALSGADGRPYVLSGGGKTIKSGQSVTFNGLRSGEELVLKGPQGRVVISADAEPGP